MYVYVYIYVYVYVCIYIYIYVNMKPHLMGRGRRLPSSRRWWSGSSSSLSLSLSATQTHIASCPVVVHCTLQPSPSWVLAQRVSHDEPPRVPPGVVASSVSTCHISLGRSRTMTVVRRSSDIVCFPPWNLTKAA